MKRALAPLSALLLLLSGCTAPATSPPPPPATTTVTVAPLPAAPIVQSQPGAENSALLLGNPSNAASDENNLLLSREAFSMSYSAKNGGPNWVAWHLSETDLGPASRGSFWPDPLLSASLQIRPSDYTGSGYDRGHVCPSGDRTRDAEYNKQTFVMSNMLPQAPQLNREVWKDLEEYERYLAKTRHEEMYIFAGGAGTAGRIRNKINVPDVCWKIILVLPNAAADKARVDKNTRVIAVAMPNRKRDEIAQSKWTDWITTVDQVEKTTGYDFLSALPDDVENALESKKDSGRAPATAGVSATISRSPGQTTTTVAVTPPVPAGSTPAPSTSTTSTSTTTTTVVTPAAPSPSGSTQVWVNTKSGKYHRPGMRYYGKTKEGEYMTEQAAQARGYSAAQR